MKENQQILKLATKSLPDPFPGDIPENAPKPELFEFLRKRLHYLLDHDMPGLLQALYRMDVDEGRVKEVLAITHPDNMSTELTLLIWERARQKIETRKKYRSE